VIHLLALLGILGISFSAVFVRLAGVSPVTTTFFRTGYALPVLFIIWLARRGTDARTRRDRLWAVSAGVILAVDLSLFHYAIDLMGVGLATVVANVQVVYVAIAAWLWQKERPSLLALPTILVVLAGVALISGLDRPDAYGQNPLVGSIAGVLAGGCYAAYLLVFRASNRRLVPSVGPLLDATFGAVVGALLLAPVDPGFSFAITWPAHGWLVAMALVCQVGGWLLIASALPRLPALETSVMLLMQPVGAVCWGLLFFAEALSRVQWTGVGLVLLGVAAFTIHGAIVRAGASGAGRDDRMENHVG
jgi:drug/metabolite transporter (DMT)-like permease